MCNQTTGIPKDSIFGPLLIYMDMNNISNSSSLYTFIQLVDDNLFNRFEYPLQVHISNTTDLLKNELEKNLVWQQLAYDFSFVK